jgi:8-oxo-dGTP diphosphatase
MNKNPQKLLHGRYHVVPRTMILIFKDDKVLLQKGAPYKKLWAGLYNGLGGHVERGEDVLTSAKRELFEEAGITCPDLHLYGMVTIDVEETEGILMFVFGGKTPQGEVRGSEEGNPEWIDISQVSELPIVHDIVVMIGKLTNCDNPQLFFGHYAYDADGKLTATFN